MCFWWLQVNGYVGSFHVRDPGLYTLQIVLGWFFGASEPGTSMPGPLLVGTHVNYQFNKCSFKRALIAGAPLAVMLAEDPTPPLPLFGDAKCASADRPGRWVDMNGIGDCVKPYCTGSHSKQIHGYDWVSFAG
jgi:hypothetical protein